MKWRYQRAFRKHEKDSSFIEHGIVEVYFNESGEIMFTSANFINLGGFDDQDDLLRTLKMINNDMKYPPLNLDTIVYAKVDDEKFLGEDEFDVDIDDESSDNGLTDCN